MYLVNGNCYFKRFSLSLAALPFFIGRNVYRMLFKSKAYERNELFLPGRMAYVVDLDDEYADTDIPTTLIRSKADCPTMEVSDPNPESLSHEPQSWESASILPQASSTTFNALPSSIYFFPLKSQLNPFTFLCLYQSCSSLSHCFLMEL